MDELREVVERRPSLHIHKLRERGFVIVNEGEGQRMQHVLIGNESRVWVLPEWREAYYHGLHWRRVRRARMKRDGWMCTLCGRLEALEVHHWEYRLFGEELEHVQTFCSPCHRYIHERLRGSGVHWPSWVEEAVAEQLITAHLSYATRPTNPTPATTTT